MALSLIMTDGRDVQDYDQSRVTVQDDQAEHQPTQVVRLKLYKPKTDKSKKVAWTADTVDNEHMNKKKSKCCCIYEKPKTFDESSSDSDDDDDECEHCRGHVEKKKKSHGEDKKEMLDQQPQDSPGI